MDSQLAPMLAIAVVVVAACAAGLVLLVPLIAQHFKGSGGWSALSKVYATTRQFPTQILHRRNIVIGRVLYRNCMTVAFDDFGLYLKPDWPLSFLGRLFIPWAEIKRVEEGRLFWRRAAQLSVGDMRVATITIPLELFNTMRPAIGKTAKTLFSPHFDSPTTSDNLTRSAAQRRSLSG